MAPGPADAPGGGAADAAIADAFEAAAVGAGACSPSLKGDKGGKRAGRQPEQERQPEKASGSDGIEPGTLGKGWTMVRVKPAHLALQVLLVLLLLLLLLLLWPPGRSVDVSPPSASLVLPRPP